MVFSFLLSCFFYLVSALFFGFAKNRAKLLQKNGMYKKNTRKSSYACIKLCFWSFFYSVNSLALRAVVWHFCFYLFGSPRGLTKWGERRPRGPHQLAQWGARPMSPVDLALRYQPYATMVPNAMTSLCERHYGLSAPLIASLRERCRICPVETLWSGWGTRNTSTGQYVFRGHIRYLHSFLGY